MKPNWLLVVSFKTELLSEYLIHKGYREDLSVLLPKIGLLRNRMIVDNDVYVDLNEVKRIQNILSEDIIAYGNKAYSIIRNQSQKLLSIAKNISDDNNYKITNHDLIERLELFFKEYQCTLSAIGIPTIIDLTLEPIIKKYLRDSKIKNIDTFFADLAISYKPVATNQEREDLLDIAVARDKGKNISRLIKNHAQKYGWLYSTLFLGDVYTARNIKEELSLVLNPRGEKERIKNEYKMHLKNAKKIINQISSDKGRQIARFLQKAVYFRTARLEWINRACFIAYPLLEEVAKRIGISFNDLIYLYPEEIYNSLNNENLNIETIHDRQNGYALISDDKQKCALFTGKELEKLKKKTNKKEKEIDIIKGLVACSGKVKGIVVIVKDRSEMNKVNKGNILVTPLTTPDFIVAMKKSAAIVTDLGGMTSHAAIVSRELNMPCIIGTKIATKVLKDGDLVEVDAKKGIVRILKNRA